jgi:DNA-binding transcriptional LysR family regulator
VASGKVWNWRLLALDPQFPLPPLCRALGAMHHRYPTVAFRILSTPLGASIDTLLEGRCHLAISGIDLVHPSIELESLIAVRRAAVVSSSHPLAKLDEKQLDVATLSDHVQIVVEDSSERTRDRDFGVVSPLKWRVADNLTKQALIAAGMGWGSLPIWMIDRELQAGALVRLPVAAFREGGETIVQTYLARRADRPLGPAASTFRQALRSELADPLDDPLLRKD